MGRPAALKAAALALLAASVASCGRVPFGEVLVVVDSEVSVPRFVAHLRVDLYSLEGAGAGDGLWYESREATALQRDAWPLSFSLFTDGALPKDVLLRLRAYPDGAQRDYHGIDLDPSPVFVEPPVALDLAGLCESLEPLAAGEERTVRYGETALLDRARTDDCTFKLAAGAAAVSVHLPAAGRYHFEVVRAVPDGRLGDAGGDTVLFLRRSCTDRTSQVVCNDNIDLNAGNLLSRIVADLPAGDYTLLVAGNTPSPADVTLRWTAESDWSKPSSTDGGTGPDDGGAGSAGSGGQRLVTDGGVDVTPPTEPRPGVTIDRLLTVHVQPGSRRTTQVLLRGECLGTQADVAGGQSCLDTSGQRVPAAAAVLTDGIQRGGATLAGSWAGEQPVPCTVAPRDESRGSDGTPLHDAEVCIPGGAFHLGAPDLIGLGERDGVPAQVAVVEPFLLDRNEVTVGRYRQALRDGFVSADPSFSLTPRANNGPLVVTAALDDRLCTFDGSVFGPAPGVARESFALDCISWRTARALCRFFGGDLPRDAQWEWAAKAVGRDADTLYPWGDDEPTCAHAVYGRSSEKSICPNGARGPSAVDDPAELADSTPLGVLGLAGNLNEWSLDSFRPYADACWHQHLLRDVGCDETNAPRRSERGGGWRSDAFDLRNGTVFGQAAGVDTIDGGVRCVRKGAP